MKKNILISGVGLFCSFLSNAQNEIDALRYSNLNYSGTARFNAMGGAFGALGADPSNFSINPAGVALYNKNEISFSPYIFVRSTNSNYNGTSSGDSKSSFNIGNIGLTATYKNQPEDIENPEGWVNTNFAIGYNNINNFHNRVSIYGNNLGSSYLNVLLNNANGTKYTDLDQFAADLAFRTYLLDTAGGESSYVSAIPLGANLVQSKSIESRGTMGETYITFGGNYSNKLYLGGTLGIDHIRYKEEYSYSETDVDNSIFDFKSYNYNGNVATKGVGFNFKFGFIYRIADFVRLGGSIHSPTFFNMTDNYSNNMTSFFDNGDSYSASSPAGSFDYVLATPMRATGSLAFIIAKMGSVSADYEFVDYSSAVLSSSPNTFFDANNAIRNRYTSTGNLRVGTEWKAGKEREGSSEKPFSIRAGYAMYGNPYKSGTGNAAYRSTYSVGLGIREKGYFLDFTFLRSIGSEKYYLYDPSLVNATSQDISSYSFITTLGFRF